MPQTRREAKQVSRAVSLHIGTSFDDAWEGVLRPWFESVATIPIHARKLIAVITSSRAQAYFLRSKILERGLSLLGVKFFSPAQLRELLLRDSEWNVPPPEHLRLLLAHVAEEFAAGKIDNESEARIAKSVARDPDNFLRALDQLQAAGWSYDDLNSSTLREIAAQFERRARECGFIFVHDADRAVKSARRFSDVLVFGLDGAHWPLWPLLRAATMSSEKGTIVLADPRDEARDLDETWVGTWEESFGAANVIAAADERSTSPSENIHFLVGRDTTEQARAIVALTAKFLGDKNCDRVGILFPRTGALPRLVATFLESARIAHNNGIAHLTPSAFDDDAWRAWLELQQNPRLKFLFRFLRATEAKIFGELSILQVEEALRRAYADVLIDNIDILREYCARKSESARHIAVARGLEAFKFLPARATLVEFLTQTRAVFAQLDWAQHWSELDRLSRNWSKRVRGAFARNIYLRWLREILGAPSLMRSDHGAHPYSRVHLLRYAEASGQHWSHLIFAGLNEEAWPQIDDVFVHDREIDELNRGNKILNQRAVKRGRHGEGQSSVRENKTLFIGSTEARQLRQRDLANLLEAARGGIGATANLYSDSFPSRIANPSDFFSRLYFATRGRGVSQQTMQSLEEQTRGWLKDWTPVDAEKIDSISIGRTRYAYDARRQSRPAGEYEFALRAPPERAITLSVTQWERALRWPALTWMKIFLGVEGEDDDVDGWPAATGQWVHHWLAQSARAATNKDFVEIAEADAIRARILEHAREFQSHIENLCRACAKPLPDWWSSGWSNALYIADCLAAKLSELSDWSRMAVELSLESPTTISLGEKESLRVRGRIDLILAHGQHDQSRIGYVDLWVVDYKTGRQRGFNLRELRRNESPEQKFRKQLIDGRGVQLALYALAAHALGAKNVQLTLLTRSTELEPQFHLEHALAQKDFWRELHRMQESGVFGMFGPVFNEFGFGSAYPLATLGIDPDLLEEKWIKTHPAFAAPSAEAKHD